MKAKLNSYLVGGGDVPMKFIKAASAEAAKKVWASKTGLDKKDPAIAEVKPPKKEKALPPKEKGQGGVE